MDRLAPQAVPRIPLVYFELDLAQDASGEWYRGHIKADTFTLFGTNSDAIFVTGAGFVDIHNIHAGSTHCMDGKPWGSPPSAACSAGAPTPSNPYGRGGQSFYGGPGVIEGYCVNAAGPDTDVYRQLSNYSHRSPFFQNGAKSGFFLDVFCYRIPAP